MTAATRDPDQLDTFAHGVASGDPLADRVIIWTRVTTQDDPCPGVAWTVATDEDLDDVVVGGRTWTDGGRDHTVKIDVVGLEPATTYFYAFEVDGQRSSIGRTRTLPTGSPQRLRLGFASCARYIDGYFNAYRGMADKDLDVVVHLGDYFYEYGNDRAAAPGASIGRAHIPDHTCKRLDDYRTRYAQHRLDEDCRALHESAPWICVFDDHECVDDRWREGGDGHDDQVDGPFADRAAAALQAWYEWLPVRMPDPDDPGRIYRRFPIGDLADLIMIDCRSYRDRQATPPEMYDARRQLLGPEQERWLFDRLSASTARWRLVGNPIMVGQVYSNLLPEWLWEPLAELGMLAEDAYNAQPDQWDGYPAARERLFSHIRREQIDNVVFMAGDVHSGWAVDVKEDPTDRIEPLAVELVTPSVTSQNLNEKVGQQTREHGADVEANIMEINPHVRWVELDDHGYVVVDVRPDRVRAEWWTVATVEERSGEERLKSAWEVRDGTSRLYPVAGEHEATGAPAPR